MITVEIRLRCDRDDAGNMNYNVGMYRVENGIKTEITEPNAIFAGAASFIVDYLNNLASAVPQGPRVEAASANHLKLIQA